MSVTDFMTTDLITVRPTTRVTDAVDLMKTNNIHRLPVIDNGKLVGLVTEGTIQRALPSKATSLSVYEANYLLNKTTVEDVMEKDVKVVQQDAVLEDAIYEMRKNNIGVLPVKDGDELVGIITNNDIFDAFLNIAGYGRGGTSVSIIVKKDSVGVIAKISDALAKQNYSILTVVVTDRKTEKIVEVHVDSTNRDGIKSTLTDAGFDVR
ncbi:CBS domain-containing protein [Paucilactobacillus sp. N302-9]